MKLLWLSTIHILLYAIDLCINASIVSKDGRYLDGLEDVSNNIIARSLCQPMRTYYQWVYMSIKLKQSLFVCQNVFFALSSCQSKGIDR
mgnify:FL=1